jgi:multisubunit Na+/H+ antiporter MnhF subunit
VNGWLWAAAVLTAALVPLAILCVRLPAPEGVIVLEAAGIDAVLALLLIAQGTDRQPFGDLALVLAIVSFVGAIAYLRFVEAFREED